MASHNLHTQIPNDIASNNLIIPAENLKPQELLIGLRIGQARRK